MKYELKAMGVGGILDQSIRIMKDHFAFFMAIMFCVQVPLSLAIRVLSEWMSVPLPPHPTPEESVAFMQSQIKIAAILVPLSILLGLTVVPITNAAITHATAKLYLGRPAGIGEAFHTGLVRFLPLAWTWFLVGIFVFGGLLLCILPGILMAFRYNLAGNVTILEGTSGMASLNRSRDLMLSDRTKHYNTVFLLGLVLIAINLGIHGIASLIPEHYVAMIVQVVLEAVVGALGLVASVVFYFSCRCRAENFDLVQLAQSVQATAFESDAASEDMGIGGNPEPRPDQGW